MKHLSTGRVVFIACVLLVIVLWISAQHSMKINTDTSSRYGSQLTYLVNITGE